MTVRLLAEFERYGKSCSYQFYPKGKKQLCGQPAVAQVGTSDYVCQEHLDFVKSSHPTPLEAPRPKKKKKK